MGGADESERLAEAIRAVIAEHPDGVEAGPKVLLAAVQASSAEFSALPFMKFKKAFAKEKAAIKAEEERIKAEALKPKVGTKDNCKGRHGLVRFLTTHNSFCCDICRCYLPVGSPMWGCRECDWDVCEGRCHPAGASITDLQNKLGGMEKQLDALVAGAPHDLKTKVALLEADVHKFEKALDNASVADLVALNILKISEEEVRTRKKALIAGSEKLLSRIDGVFADINDSEQKAPQGSEDKGEAVADAIAEAAAQAAA